MCSFINFSLSSSDNFFSTLDFSCLIFVGLNVFIFVKLVGNCQACVVVLTSLHDFHTAYILGPCLFQLGIKVKIILF